MWKCTLVIGLLIASQTSAPAQERRPPERKPNIVVILADDIGYGDIGCYGATKVKTPRLDQLARQGVRFSDGHSASATCTPSRYSLLTGQYAWRHKAGSSILPGDAPLCIPLDRLTLPMMLKRAGYATACVGKWHLGLGAGKLDFNGEVKPGPREVGFDYSFILPATGDRVPTVYLEDGKVAGLDPKDPIEVSYKGKVGNEPTGKENPELLKMKLSHGHDATIVNGISRIGFMAGGKAARWVDEDMADVLVNKATRFIETNKDRPFFLYFPTHDIHVPRVPHARFKGSSECGVRGDVIQQFDWTVGAVLDALKKHGLDENTIVLVSSDNGPVVDDGYADGAVANLNGHTPAGRLRGGKYTLFEGGHRVPFLVRWTGVLPPGESAETICLIDWMATSATLAGAKLPNEAAPDSFDFSALVRGKTARSPRRDLVYHAGRVALRQGPWVYMPNAATKKMPKAQELLFNLDSDPEQKQNVAALNEERVRLMADRLKKIREGERTRP